MTNDNKPPMFGPTFTFDPASHVPRSGKSALVNELMAELAGKPKAVADTIFGNCTTAIPLKFAFYGEDTGHTVVIAPTRNGMSVLLDHMQHEQAKAGGSVSVGDIGLSKHEKD